jgi:hypothetical protein
MRILCFFLVAASASINEFLDWAVNRSVKCGIPFPTTSLTLAHNLYPCATPVAAVYTLITYFEGSPHLFGITACSDNNIFVGVRVEDDNLVYMHFEAQKDFLAFMNECVIGRTNNKVLHLTVANTPHPGLDALRLTSSLHNVQTRVLGMGNKTPIGHGGHGFGLKLLLLHQELNLVPPDTPILFTDAFDVLIQSSLKPLQNWILNNPTQILFAAETTKWPSKDLFYPPPLHFPYPYLNSGVFAGRASTLLKILNDNPYTMKTDDQEYYTTIFLTQNTIQLDHRAEFFQCLQGVDSKHITFAQKVSIKHFDGQKEWETKPLILHLNNGVTRLKYFSKCIKSVLGNSYTYLSRQIFITLLLDFASYNSSTIFYVIVSLLVLAIVMRVMIM